MEREWLQKLLPSFSKTDVNGARFAVRLSPLENGQQCFKKEKQARAAIAHSD